MLRRFPVTSGLMLLLGVVFLVEWLAGGTMSTEVHLRMGAVRPDRVFEHGEYYRLFTAMFLHHGPIHIAFNGFALLQLGALTEHFYGSTRTLAFYLLCGLAASLCSVSLMSPMVSASVGASGAIMGLAGVILGGQMYGVEAFREPLNLLLGRRLVFGVALTFALGFVVDAVMPMIDNYAHIGGFAMGLVLAGVYRDPDAPAVWSDRLAASAFAVGTAAALGVAAIDGGEAVQTLDLDTAHQMEAGVLARPDGVVASVMLVRMLAAYEEAGQPEEALRALERSMERSHEFTTPLQVAGLMEAPTDAQMDIVMARAFTLAPEDPVVLNALAWHLVTRNHDRDPERAVTLSERSLERLDQWVDERPQSDWMTRIVGLFSDWQTQLDTQRAASLDTHAEALYQLNRLAEAHDAQEQAVALATRLELDILPELQARLDKIQAN